MFKLELSDSSVFKNAFKSIAKIVDEVTMTCDSEALRLNCLSRDHITFITMELKKELFDSYECSEPMQIAIDSVEFEKLLKKCKTTDILEISVDDFNVNLIFKGDATKKFHLRQIDMEYENAQPPEVNTPCNISIKSALIDEYIKDMEFYSDSVNFIVDENYFKLSTEGNSGNAEIEYIHGENISEVVKACFSIPRLKEIFEASKFSQSVTLGIGTDMPLIVKYELPTGDGHLNYLLAPRLESDDS